MAESAPAQALTIDGLQLLFPGTGLALVTSELLRGLASLQPAPRIRLILPRGVSLQAYDLSPEALEIVEVPAPRLSPDYLFRAEWGRRVASRLRALPAVGRLFIPYLFNYGRWSENLVLLPDLVNRLVPDYGAPDPLRPWWSLRGRLPFRRFVRRFEEWKVTRARCVIVYSSFVRKHAAEALRIPPERFSEIRLAAPHWITGAPVTAPLPREIEALLPDCFVIYVGGYAKRKNIPLLLRVCGAVYALDSSFRCVFAGLSERMLAADPELAQAWHSPRVRAAAVLLPVVGNDALAPLYRRAQFAVYPSRSEGFGLPLVEAAACERLCLCGDNSSMVELQPNADYRVDADDERAWVERIAQLWSNPGQCAEAGRECARGLRDFSWQRAATQLLEAGAL